MADRKIVVMNGGLLQQLQSGDDPVAPTQATGDSTTKVATTAFAMGVVAPATHAATSKATPVDADEIPLVDSAASYVLKKLTWANLKATAKTYFDTLYQSKWTFVDQTDSFTAGTTNFVYYRWARASSGTSAGVMTLPAVSGNSGLVMAVELTTGGVGSARTNTVDGNGSEYIGEYLTIGLTAVGDVLMIVCDGAKWHILSWIRKQPNYASPSGLYLSVREGIMQPSVPYTSQGTLWANINEGGGDCSLIPNSDGTDFYAIATGPLSKSLTMTSGKAYDVFLSNYAAPALYLSAAWRNTGQFITGATNATPIVITSNAHGLSNGDQAEITGVPGNLAANGTWIVANKTTNTYELTGSVGSGAYTSGGWMSARVDALSTVKGILVNDGAITGVAAKGGTYLGSIYASGTNVTEQSGTKWYVDNMYNRKKIGLSVGESAASWSYTTTTVRQANGNAANQVEFFIGRPRFISANLTSLAGSTASGAAGIGVDSTTVMSGRFPVSGSSSVTCYVNNPAFLEAILGSGKHYLAWLEKGPGVACTWYGLSAGYCDYGVSADYQG